MRTARETWEAAKGGLQVQISRANFNTWIKDSVGLSHRGQQFVVGTPSSFAREWLDKHCRSLVTKVLISILGEQVEVQFEVCSGREPGAPARESPPALLVPMVNPRHTFESFVVGSSNRLAFMAAMAAAEGPGREHNPLYIHGPSGVGKSHIAHAIANYASESGMRVVCASSEQFTNEFVNSLRERRTDDFRARFRNTNLLVLEDVQFMTGKPQTQETLFHTINDLHASEGQLVITSDRTPASLTSMDASLWSRLGAGLVAEMEFPDVATRLGILRAQAARYQGDIDQAVLEYIARQCHQNVRQLESCLNLVIARARMLCQPPTLLLAQQALREIAPPPASPVIMTPVSILDAVAAYFQVSLEALKGPSRNQKVTQARHIAIYLVREKTTCGLQDLGRLLSRDHSTVVRGHRKIAGMLSTDASLRKSVDEILATFSP